MKPLSDHLATWPGVEPGNLTRYGTLGILELPLPPEIGFAEWLAINYGGQGVKVSVLCPQAVRTAMTDGREQGVASLDGMMEAEDLAEHVIRAMGEESFLITPHGEVLDYIQGKTADYDRWIGGMQRLKQKYGNGI